MTLHTKQPGIQYPRITLSTNKEYIYNMYIIDIPELEFSSLSFLPNTFADPLSVISHFSEESLNIKAAPVALAYSPRRVSQVLAPLDLHFEVDHHHHMIGVLLDSTFSNL